MFSKAWIFVQLLKQTSEILCASEYVKYFSSKLFITENAVKMQISALRLGITYSTVYHGGSKVSPGFVVFYCVFICNDRSTPRFRTSRVLVPPWLELGKLSWILINDPAQLIPTVFFCLCLPTCVLYSVLVVVAWG